MRRRRAAIRLRHDARGGWADAMSVITVERIERAAAPDKPAPEVMPHGIALSATLHVGLLALVLLGLPNLFRMPPPEETPIAVELVTIAPHTKATHPNRFRPVPKTRPEPPKAPPAPVPPAKPAPPQAAAAPPASAAPPPRPAPSIEPKHAVKQPPLPPPPPPKPVAAARPPIPPPLPPEKPKPASRPAHPAAPTETTKAEAAAFEKLLDHLERKPPPPPAFDALLKNLTRDNAAQADEAPPKPRQVAAAAPASSQPRAPLDSRLTASQIDLIIRKIEGCWDVPAGARDAKDLNIEIKAALDPDGTVRQAVIVSTARYASDPFFRAAADSAKRALLDPRCSPLPVPRDKYEAWHNLDLFFNPKDLL